MPVMKLQENVFLKSRGNQFFFLAKIQNGMSKIFGGRIPSPVIGATGNSIYIVSPSRFPRNCNPRLSPKGPVSVFHFTIKRSIEDFQVFKILIVIHWPSSKTK